MKDNPALPGGSLKSKPTWESNSMLSHVGFFYFGNAPGAQHRKSRRIGKTATGCLPSHNKRATTLDSHRSRRTKDRSRKAWYAYYRQVRFARWLGFVKVDGDLIRAYRRTGSEN